MIKNSTILTDKNIATFQNNFARKSNIFSLIMCLVVIACGIIELVLQDTAFGIFCIVFGVIFFPLLLFMQRLANKKNIKSMSLTNVSNEYEFGDDYINIVTLRDGAQVGQSQVQYQNIFKADELDDAYYVYISNRQAFIVDKKSFTEGTATDLTILLSTKLQDRYKVKLSKKLINENKKDV